MVLATILVKVYLSIDRSETVNETAERLMDLAEAHIRNAGYGGFSFRDLATVARRPNERAKDAISGYRSAFRAALDRDGRMCLCGVLGAEAGVLLPEVAEEIVSLFRRCID